MERNWLEIKKNVECDKNIPADKSTMEVIRNVANCSDGALCTALCLFCGKGLLSLLGFILVANPPPWLLFIYATMLLNKRFGFTYKSFD